MVIIISISFIFIIIIKTCHDDGLAKVFQHEGQGGACVGEGVRPVQDNKPDHDCHDHASEEGDDDDEDASGAVEVIMENKRKRREKTFI